MLFSSQTEPLVDRQTGCGRDCYIFILCSLFYPRTWRGYISQSPLQLMELCNRTLANATWVEVADFSFRPGT